MKEKKTTTTKKTTPIKSKETTVKTKDTTAEKKLVYPTLKESIPMTDEERALFDIIRQSKIIAAENVTLLFEMYNRLFVQRKKRCLCGGVIKNMVDTINKYYY